MALKRPFRARTFEPRLVGAVGKAQVLPTSGSGGGSGDDNPGGGGPPYIAVCRRFVGPIVYCGHQEFVTQSGFAPQFFRNRNVSGTYRSKFTTPPACPDVGCTISSNILGIATAVFSGQVSIDPSDCSPTGELTLDFTAEGWLPYTSYMLPWPDGASLHLTAESVANLLAQIPGWVVASQVNETPNIRTYFTPFGEQGCFVVQGPGYGIGCEGAQFAESLGSSIDPTELGYVWTDNGCTQTIETYDDVTNTFTGSLVSVNLRVFQPATVDSVLVTLTFEVEPIGGGAIETIYDTQRLYGTGGSFNEHNLQFPRQIGYDVRLINTSVSLAAEIVDDFESYTVNSDGSAFYNYLGDSGGWPFVAGFMAPAPNGFAADDFENYDTETSNVVTNLGSGFYWAAGGDLLSADPLEASDDFEAYTDGDTLYNFALGVGWLAPGYALSDSVVWAYDDLETYIAGTIAVLDAYPLSANTGSFWSASGSVLANPDLDADDDLESYGVGAITLLDGGDGLWSDDGTFI